MVTPNSSFDELASLTISRYSKTLRDNVTNQIPLYAFMKDEGAIEEVDGGVYLIENLDFGDNGTFTWYNGYQEIPITPSEVFTTAQFDWKECAGNAVFSRREVAQNSGESKQIDLIKGKVKNLERTIVNNLGAALHYAGTENGGLSIGGLQYIVADTPTSGIVGGINRATAGNEWWRNAVVDEGDDSITFSATTMQDAMELGWVRAARGMDVPTLFVMGNTHWRFFAGSVNANSRYIRESDAETAKTSFPYYSFKTAKVFNDPNARAASSYGLNTNWLKLKVHKDRNLDSYPAVRPANQTASIITMDFMGNLVCANSSVQVVFHA